MMLEYLINTGLDKMALEFVKNNLLVIGAVLAFLKGLAKITPWAEDDKIVQLLTGAVSKFMPKRPGQEQGFARQGALMVLVGVPLLLCFIVSMVSCAPAVSVCDNAEKSIICEKFSDIGVRVEDADLILMAVNLRLIKEGVYSKDDVLKFFDLAEAFLDSGSVSYRAYGKYIVNLAGDYPELIILSRYIDMLDSTRFISTFDRDLLLAHIQHQREALE